MLIDKTGHIFHVDFGYIFGKEPPAKKILAPPIRICKEMLETMGGPKDENYKIFLQKCVESFLYLRNHQRYILNLFYIMIHSGIKDLGQDYDKVLTQMHEKFMPNLSNIDAEKEFVNIIKESVNAFFPKLLEKIHEWALYMK